jgi:hypothetical protein
MRLQPASENDIGELGDLIVGNEDSLIVSTQTFESSYQNKQLAAILGNAEHPVPKAGGDV